MWQHNGNEKNTDNEDLAIQMLIEESKKIANIQHTATIINHKNLKWTHPEGTHLRQAHLSMPHKIEDHKADAKELSILIKELNALKRVLKILEQEQAEEKKINALFQEANTKVTLTNSLPLPRISCLPIDIYLDAKEDSSTQIHTAKRKRYKK